MGIKLLDGKDGSFLGNDCKNFPQGGCGGGGGGNERGDDGGDRLLLLSSSSFGLGLSFNLLSLFLR